MQASPTPDLAVSLITDSGYRGIHASIEALARQTIADRIEVVIAAADGTEVEAEPSHLDALHSIRVVPYEGEPILSHARIETLRAATARFFTTGEDHCFLAPEWAERVLARHREGYDIVGPVMVNANVDSAVSWAAFLVSYGEFAVPTTGGETDTTAGHNTSYRRDALLGLGDDLEYLLRAENVLQLRLKKQGLRLFTDPEARAHHVNLSRLSVLLEQQIRGGRNFAAVWSQSLGGLQRAWLTLIGPLIGVRRGFRLLGLLPGQPIGRWKRIKVASLILAGQTLSGVGYSLGFLTGTPDGPYTQWQEEIRRAKLLSRADRKMFISEIV